MNAHDLSMQDGDVILDESLNSSGLLTTENMDTTQKILPNKIAFNTLHTCIILEVLSPHEFYIHREPDYKCILKLSKETDAQAEVADECVDPQIGEICLGRYTLDDDWYRAKVMAKLDDDRYEVYYMDYSNVETIDISRMRQCPEKLRNIPEFAIKCCLFDVSPAEGETWSDESIKTFKSMIVEGTSEVMVYNTEETDGSYICQVELRISHSVLAVKDDIPFSARKALAFMGYALFRGKPFVYEKSCAELDNYDLCYSLPEINLPSRVHVQAGKIHTPWSFYLYLESERRSHDIEVSSLQEHCRGFEDDVKWNIFNPLKGMLCVVLENNMWHRALVNKVLGNGQVKLLIVDTGNELVTSFTNLRKLPDSFARTAVRAIKCSLADVFPMGEKQEEEWTEGAINFFSDWLYTNKNQLKANITKKKYDLFEVHVTASNGRKVVDIAQLLVEKSFALSNMEKFDPLLSGCADMDPHEDKQYASMNKTSFYVSDRNAMILKPVQKSVQKKDQGVTAFNKRVDITYLKLRSPDCIFVRFVSQDVHSRELQKRLWLEWKTFTKAGEAGVVVGGVYAVEYKKECYGRVKVLKIEQNHCMTHLFDLGGLKAYGVDQLYTLPADLAKTKGFAAIVKLANIIPTCGSATWPKTTIDVLQDALCKKQDYFIVKCGSAYRDANLYNLKILPVNLGWVDERIDGAFDPTITTYPMVNQFLLNSGLALPDRNCSPSVTTDNGEGSAELQEGSISEISVADFDSSVNKSKSPQSLFTVPKEPVKTWPPPEILTETTFDAVVSNVDKDCNIYFHLVESDRLLQQMVMTYEYKYEKTRQTNDDLHWGLTSPVVAQYHADDNWYRAIVNAINKDSVSVFFVDYGNKDNICMNQIRAPGELYMKTPILCYIGQLCEIAPLTDEWDVNTLDYIHHIIVEQPVKITLLEPHRSDTVLKMRIEMTATKQDLATFLVSVGNICKFAEKEETQLNHQNEVESPSVVEINDHPNGREMTPHQTAPQFRSAFQSEPSPPERQQLMPLEQHTFDLPECESVASEPLVEAPVVDFTLPKWKLPMDCAESFPVHVTKIVNTRNIFVIPYSENGDISDFVREVAEIEKQYCSMIESIGQDVRHSFQSSIDNWTESIYLCEREGHNCRVCVLGVYDEEVKVRFFDHGIEDIVFKNTLKTTPEVALKVPPRSIPISIVASESQALRNLLYDTSKEAILENVNRSRNKIYASVVVNRQIPILRLFTKENGARCNLFEHLHN